MSSTAKPTRDPPLLLPRGLLLDADGNPIQESEAAIRAENVLRESPYTASARTPKYERFRQDREEAWRSKRDPALRARKRMGAVVQEMMKIGNELKDFRVARTDPQAQRKRLLSGEVPKFLSPGGKASCKRPRPRNLPERLRPKRDKLAAVTAKELLDEWGRHDAEEPARERPEIRDQTTERVVEAALDASTTLQGVQSVRELPSRRDIVHAYGHAPKFYGVKRHPPPGRLPPSLATPQGKEAFKVVPKTDWRDAPDDTVLQKAYTYMLDNVAVSEEIDLAVTASAEMQANLAGYFDANVGNGFWRDEVTSMVAEPLGMEAYCAQRSAQETSAPSAPVFVPDFVQEEPPHETSPAKFLRVDPRPLADAAPPRHASPAKAPAPYYSKDDQALLAVDLPAVARGEAFRFSREAAEAATCIQRQWRRVLGRSTRAATLIETRARGMAARLRAERLRREKVAVVVLLQTYIRGWLGRRVLDYLRMASSYNLSLPRLAEWELVRIPRNIKISLARQRAEEARLRRDREVGRLLANVQARVRSSCAHKHVAMLRHLRKYQVLVAQHLQRVFRGNKTRQELETMRRAVRVGLAGIQARFRGRKQRRRYLDIMSLRDRKAREIQRVYRGHCGRLEAAQQRLERASATKMSALARGAFARQFVRRWRASRVEAERRRLGLEGAQMRKAALEAGVQTKAFLKTVEGKKELRERTQVAKMARLARKDARTRMKPDQLRRSHAEEAFELFDLDGSGEIDEKEFRKALAELCLPLSNAQIRVALESMDEDGNGVVTLNEFIRWHVESSTPGAKSTKKKQKKTKGSPHLGKTVLDSGDDDDEDDDDDDFVTGVGAAGKPRPAQFAWAKAAKQANATVAAAIKLKLKTTKALRDLSGLTDRRAASRSIYAARAEVARAEAQNLFRASQPADVWYHTYILKG